MSNHFRLIQSGSIADYRYITSMHRLRYSVFHEELKWTIGLQLSESMEFDEYDRPGTRYIIGINDSDEVEAACRIIPTNERYMIADHYPEFVETIQVPNTSRIWEMSRFCASPAARTNSKGKISGQLIAAAIEFGLVNGLSNYVALATDNIVPYMRRIVGWDPVPVGKRKRTPDDYSYCVLYSVSDRMLDRIRSRNQITGPLLFDTSKMTLWREDSVAA